MKKDIKMTKSNDELNKEKGKKKNIYILWVKIMKMHL